MKRMATVLAPDPAAYRTDLVAWADTQAAMLRAGRHGAADMPNIIEEIEGLAQQRRSELRNRLSTIVQHWLKLELSPASEPRLGWRRTIALARLEIEELVEDNPSLERELPERLRTATRIGIKRALIDLTEFGEVSPTTRSQMEARSFALDEVLNGEPPK